VVLIHGERLGVNEMIHALQQKKTAEITFDFEFFSSQKWNNFSYYSLQEQIISLYCTNSRRETAKVSFLPFAVNVMLNLSIYRLRSVRMVKLGPRA